MAYDPANRGKAVTDARLVQYSKMLPTPFGFDYYDGADGATESITIFRSADEEIIVKVTVQKRD